MIGLRTTARAIAYSRTLEQQRAIARTGQHPIRRTWYPPWKADGWKPTDPVASIMTRWSGARARDWGRIGGLSRSLAKAQAARRNGRLSRGPRRLDHGNATVLQSVPSGPVYAQEHRPRQERAR